MPWTGCWHPSPDKCFAGIGCLINRVYNRLIILILFCFGLNAAMAQRTITGHVIDVNDKTDLPQVTVLLKGTTTGTPTDQFGKFSLTVPEFGGVLIIRYLGYETQEIEITRNSHYEIKLEPEVFDENTVFYLPCSPPDYVQIGLLSGKNHLHQGYGIELQLVGLRMAEDRSFPLHLNAVFQHRFFKYNRQINFRVSRFDNFHFSSIYVNTEIEYTTREVRLGENIQQLDELALINTAQTRLGNFGIGGSIQTEELEGSIRKSVALVIEYYDSFLRGYFIPRVQLKKWHKATQLRWELEGLVPGTGLRLSINGTHYAGFDELSAGLAYRFRLK